MTLITFKIRKIYGNVFFEKKYKKNEIITIKILKIIRFYEYKSNFFLFFSFLISFVIESIFLFLKSKTFVE